MGKIILLLLLLLGILLLAVILFFSRYSIARVSGWSMYPTYYPGDLCVYKRKFKNPDYPKVYILKNPEEDGKILIKRCTYYTESVYGGNQMFVEGDNKDNSRDSREFGFVPIEAVLGEVVWTWKRRRKMQESN